MELSEAPGAPLSSGSSSVILEKLPPVFALDRPRLSLRTTLPRRLGTCPVSKPVLCARTDVKGTRWTYKTRRPLQPPLTGTLQTRITPEIHRPAEDQLQLLEIKSVPPL